MYPKTYIHKFKDQLVYPKRYAHKFFKGWLTVWCKCNINYNFARRERQLVKKTKGFRQDQNPYKIEREMSVNLWIRV